MSGESTCVSHAGGILALHPELACTLCKNVLVKVKYKYHPLCFRCYCVTNPGIKIKGGARIREHFFKELLETQFSGIKMVFDTMVDGGCSKRRPDCRIECLTHTVIVENDENSHASYETICENKRDMEIFTDCGSRPIVFIRFNPDSYIDKEGVRHPGCFRYKNGLKLVKEQWNLRTPVLLDCVKLAVETVPTRDITRHYLFYDAK